MRALAKQTCVPCQKGAFVATVAERKQWLAELPEWRIQKKSGVPTLTRQFKFPDFTSALKFVNRIGAAADKQDHHPEISLGYGLVTVAWNTHSINNLHRNDFVMAAKTDTFYWK